MFCLHQAQSVLKRTLRRWKKLAIEFGNIVMVQNRVAVYVRLFFHIPVTQKYFNCLFPPPPPQFKYGII